MCSVRRSIGCLSVRVNPACWPAFSFSIRLCQFPPSLWVCPLGPSASPSVTPQPPSFASPSYGGFCRANTLSTCPASLRRWHHILQDLALPVCRCGRLSVLAARICRHWLHYPQGLVLPMAARPPSPFASRTAEKPYGKPCYLCGKACHGSVIKPLVRNLIPVVTSRRDVIA